MPLHSQADNDLKDLIQPETLKQLIKTFSPNDDTTIHILFTRMLQYVMLLASASNSPNCEKIYAQCIDHMEKQSNTAMEHQQLKETSLFWRIVSSNQLGRDVWISSSGTKTLLQLSRQLYIPSKRVVSRVDQDFTYDCIASRAHFSKAIRNIVTSAGRWEELAPLLDSNPKATASPFSLLYSHLNTPMTDIFKNTSDVADLPVFGAGEVDATTEFGWMDVLTSWTMSSQPTARNAIKSLHHLLWLAICDSNGFSRMQVNQLLQAWMLRMLQSIRELQNGQEVLAITQVEEAAAISHEVTPGSEKVDYDPIILTHGLNALAVFAEQHHAELIARGVVPLTSLIAAVSAHESEHMRYFRVGSCARVIANLVASTCATLQSQNVLDSNVPHIQHELERFKSGKAFLERLIHWNCSKNAMERSNFYRAIVNMEAMDDILQNQCTSKPVYHDCLNPIPPLESTLLPHRKKLDIILIHGLRGHPFETWRTDTATSASANRNSLWPEEFLLPDLAAHNIQARVLTLGYEAGMVSWSSPWPSLSLPERAKLMLDALQSAKVDLMSAELEASTPIVFITHSLGGLLVKEMLLQAACQSPHSAKNVAGVIFFAVPHFGSDLVKGVHTQAIRSLLRTHPALVDLFEKKGRLEFLNDSFRSLYINCLSFGESKPSSVGFGISAMIVKPKYANPLTGAFYIVPGADHMSICKATSPQDPVYRRVVEYIVQRGNAQNDVQEAERVEENHNTVTLQTHETAAELETRS